LLHLQLNKLKKIIKNRKKLWKRKNKKKKSLENNNKRMKDWKKRDWKDLKPKD
jgi:hypothetical protein